METQTTEYKSIQKIRTGDKGFKNLAITCVALANAQGGTIRIGVEDKTLNVPAEQKITITEINDTISRLRSLCFNVYLSSSDILTDKKGGQYFEIEVAPSLTSIASTSEGKYYIRIADKCEPVRSEDMVRLATEKASFQWELICTRKVKLTDVPSPKIADFADRIRKSERVHSEHIRQMSDVEIAENYNLVNDGYLTYLGILWLGNAAQRSRITYPIGVQYIVYDEIGNKIRKKNWHDNLYNPAELLLEIESEATELKYFYEFPNGLFRRQIYHYAPELVRELLLNAFAHHCFTISGDIMIEVHPDRLEISNPGGLPLGVNKDNILHERQRRNPHFIRIMHDLGFMEGEGSGYDLIYALNARDAKPLPIIESTFNYTKITQYSTITNEEIIQLLAYVDEKYHLPQKDMIALGIVAQHQKILSTELTRILQLTETERMRSYVDKALNLGILITRGHKKGTAFLINPKLFSNAKLNVKTTLKTIEPHYMRSLIMEDLRLHPGSKIAEVSARIPDIELKEIRKFIYSMVADNILRTEGARTNRVYFLNN